MTLDGKEASEVIVDEFVEETPEDILKQQLDKKNEKPNNEKAKNSSMLPLGNLGSFKKVPKDEIKDIFDKLPETIFQIKNCLFRISAIDIETNSFTAELINGED